MNIFSQMTELTSPITSKFNAIYSINTLGLANILGGSMVGTHTGDMIGEIALDIGMGADAVDSSALFVGHAHRLGTWTALVGRM